MPKKFQPSDKWRLLIRDNFHYQDPDEEWVQGPYETAEEAISAAKRIVDDYLSERASEKSTVDGLLNSYLMFGESPDVLAPAGQPQTEFSSWEYAQRRAQELCQQKQRNQA